MGLFNIDVAWTEGYLYSFYVIERSLPRVHPEAHAVVPLTAGSNSVGPLLHTLSCVAFAIRLLA